MSKKRKQQKNKAKAKPRQKSTGVPSEASLRIDYNRARRLACTGQRDQARQLYDVLDRAVNDPHLRALIANDRAALVAQEGRLESAWEGFRAALALDEQCGPARANLTLVEEDLRQAAERAKRAPLVSEGSSNVGPISKPAAGAGRIDNPSYGKTTLASGPGDKRTKVALLSLLFNWPTTGGGNVHSYELALFLTRAGYDVRHFFARFPPWGIGAVPGPLPYAGEALAFDEAGWHAAGIQERFRRTVAAFSPDHVIVTDSWNFSLRPADRILDGCGLIPPKGGHHHGPRQSAGRAEGTAVAAMDQPVANQRIERAGLLCPPRLGYRQLLQLAAGAGAARDRTARVRAGTDRGRYATAAGQRSGTGAARRPGGAGRSRL
jgi:hypothetical protein